MKKILLIISLLFSIASYSQVYQQFGAFSDNLDSLYTHVGKHHQYVVVLGRFNANDGLGGVYIYDTTLTTAEIPYLNFQVVGKDTGRWTLVQFLSQGGGGTDTTIFANPNYAVLDIISDPPTSVLDAKYIVLTPGTGDWAGHDNNIATGTGTTPEWTFDTATVNQIASNAADNNLYIFTGSEWVALALNLHQNGENYGEIDIVAGNRRNKAFRFITNDTIRGGFDSVGSFRLNKYGAGNITGTPTFTLQVDADGNIIEGSGGGGSTTLQQAFDNSITALDNPTINAHVNDLTIDSLNLLEIELQDLDGAFNANSHSQITIDPTGLGIANVTDTTMAQIQVVTADSTGFEEGNYKGIEMMAAHDEGLLDPSEKVHAILVYPDFVKAYSETDSEDGIKTHFIIENADSLETTATTIAVFDNDTIKKYPTNAFSETWEQTLNTQGSTPFTSNHTVQFDSTSMQYDSVASFTMNGLTKSRMLFIGGTKRGAFRVGQVTNLVWDTDSIGAQSFAAGVNTLAKGQASVALNSGSKANGTSSVAMVAGVASSAGNNVAIGSGAQAVGIASHAYGQNDTALTTNSMAFGTNINSKNPYGVVVGTRNALDTPANTSSFNVLNKAFQVGIGNPGLSTDFKNALTILFNGKTTLNQYGAGTFTGTATYSLSVDANGNIIETTAGGGGGTTTNALTVNDGGSGDASPFTFDGSAARTISYNSIGAVPATRTVNGKALSSNITLDLASADFANQGTTSTVLHGNASGNPTFGQVAIGTEVSGLGTGVATFLGTPSSANLATALTDETGTGVAVFNSSPSFVNGISVSSTATLTGNVMLNTNSLIFRTTNGGSNITSVAMVDIGGSVSTAGALGVGFDNTTGFQNFTAANGTRRISRGYIGINNLVNTAGSESGDLVLGTQSGGTAASTKLTISSGGNVTVANGNLTLGTAGNKITITEGSDGRLGQTTLVSGTKAITINGLTTSSRAFVQLVAQGGTSTTVYNYIAVCTSNTLTITAITVAGATVTTDTSVLNYVVYN